MKDPRVIFRDIDHSYWLGSGPIEDRTKMTSVNTYWTSFLSPFPRDLVICNNALARVIGHNKFWRSYFPREHKISSETDLQQYYGMYMGPLYEEVKLLIDYEWSMANVCGTELHDYLEEKAYSDGYVVNPYDGKKYETRRVSKEYDNQSIADDLFELEDGCYPELVVWHEPSLGCGQGDYVFIRTVDGFRFIDMLDNKSNGGHSEEDGKKKRAEITKPKKKKSGKGHLMGTGPLSDLYDCTYTKYQGQNSMYGAVLEEAGYICEHIGIMHFLDFDPAKGKLIEHKYLGDHAKAVLKHYSTES